jgi:hypothetical protein
MREVDGSRLLFFQGLLGHATMPPYKNWSVQCQRILVQGDYACQGDV